MSWKRVRGHEPVVQMFDRAVQRGRLAHGYLLAGPPGVGKRLFAEELAKALLCESPEKTHLEACDQCAACTQVAADTHPDLFIAGRPEDKLELPIEVMRELSQSFSLKSARGRGKVAILDDADDLNEESANCFLKTLEEPPPRSVLLLIGASPDRQLPTIVSRCQVVHFMPLAQSLVAELLRTHGLQDAALVDRLARMSGGSVGQALALADPALWEFRATLLANLCQSPMDSVPLAQAWIRFVEEAGKEASAQRRRAALVLTLLIEFLHSALAVSVGSTPRLAEPSDVRAAQGLAAKLDADRLLDILERCLEANMYIDRRVQLVLVLEAITDALQRALRR